MIWLIGVGGSIGAFLRYFLSIRITKIAKNIKFPLSTWIINVTGSFILGILANLYNSNQIGLELWYFAGVGFCGAYTTFSTFGYETIKLLQSQHTKVAMMYVVTSVITGLIFAFFGFLLLK